MSTQEPPATEVLCYQCSGLGKLRITFGDPPQWAKCGKCSGTGKLHRSGGTFVGALPDLEAFGKRKNFDLCRVEPSHKRATIGENPIPCDHIPHAGLALTAESSESEGKVSQQPARLSSDLKCSMCEQRALMIYMGAKYCAQHGMEVLK